MIATIYGEDLRRPSALWPMAKPGSSEDTAGCAISADPRAVVSVSGRPGSVDGGGVAGPPAMGARLLLKSCQGAHSALLPGLTWQVRWMLRVALLMAKTSRCPTPFWPTPKPGRKLRPRLAHSDHSAGGDGSTLPAVDELVAAGAKTKEFEAAIVVTDGGQPRQESSTEVRPIGPAIGRSGLAAMPHCVGINRDSEHMQQAVGVLHDGHWTFQRAAKAAPGGPVRAAGGGLVGVPKLVAVAAHGKHSNCPVALASTAMPGAKGPPRPDHAAQSPFARFCQRCCSWPLASTRNTSRCPSAFRAATGLPVSGSSLPRATNAASRASQPATSTALKARALGPGVNRSIS